MADPDAVAGLLVQLAGGVDELSQLGELRVIDTRRARPFAQDHPGAAPSVSASSSVRQREACPSTVIDHLEVEPVRLGRRGVGVVARGERDDRRARGGPVVGSPAGLLQLDHAALGQLFQGREHVVGEPDGLVVLEHLALDQAVVKPVAVAQPETCWSVSSRPIARTASASSSGRRTPRSPRVSDSA